MKKVKLMTIFMLVIILLLSGFIPGYLVGGRLVHEQWVMFNEEKNDAIDEHCVCNFPEIYNPLEGFALDIIYNNTYNNNNTSS